LQRPLTIAEIDGWKKYNKTFLQVHTIHASGLSRKFAGVGWARKIGMDEAVKQIYRSGQEDGIIVSFDADSTVSPNYLQEIENAFAKHPGYNFFTINFAHPIGKFKQSGETEGIVRYELHMRYYRHAIKWVG